MKKCCACHSEKWLKEIILTSHYSIIICEPCMENLYQRIYNVLYYDV